MRFNSSGYVEEWKMHGTFPAIHDAVAHTCKHLQGRRVLDLCCSTGLLGQRLIDDGMADYVMGMDADRRAIQTARQAGVEIDFVHLKITKPFLKRVIEVIGNVNINAVVARRCLPELFGHDLDFGKEFFAALHKAGVKELVIEGRVPTSKAVNKLATLAEEIMLVSESYELVHQHKQCAYLKARS